MIVRVSDREWEFIEPILSHLPQPKHPGRPRASERDLFDAILYVLSTGIPWSRLPEEYPAKSSCHRRFQAWSHDGSFDRLRRTLLRRIQERHRLDLEEGFIDGSFIKAKRGAKKLRTRHATQAKEALH